MTSILQLDQVAINIQARKILDTLLKENPEIKALFEYAKTENEALIALRNWILPQLKKNNAAYSYYLGKNKNPDIYNHLKWPDLAAIRLLDYINHAGEEYKDQNLRGEMAISNPVKMLWLAINFGTGGARASFFTDMLFLFSQLKGKTRKTKPSKKKILSWMENHPSGLDQQIITLRTKNRERIIQVLIEIITETAHSKYTFEKNLSFSEKKAKINNWWNESQFHLTFAIRSPQLLNKMLGNSLDPDTLKILYDAEKQGIPFFVNPYYLSLLNVAPPNFALGADLAIRQYIIYSEHLVKEFGYILAWEKEDQIQPGKPNAAGWLLPSHNIHRRYPEVAIFIPDTMGRACAGLCASCQRLYDFQSGRFNFNLEKLKPQASWPERLKSLLTYYENDSQLRDILITGGDALMTSDKQLEKILEEVYQMAVRKKEANKNRKEGEKYAEIIRVRLGSRLLVYLPQRITSNLIELLLEYKQRFNSIGVQQLIIQTHFVSAMEITPEVKLAIENLLAAGWIVTNQMVFTAAASRRGHTSKLRKVLNDMGVLSYYSFTVKGYMENHQNFSPNSRIVQEEIEEKNIGSIPDNQTSELATILKNPKTIKESLEHFRKKLGVPFLATDRNIINLPGVGKSLTFRTIGITRYGRRILEFDHDPTRNHSPIIHHMEKVIIVESKSISKYLEQLEEMGEDSSDYEGIYGYSIGQTEPRMAIYEYPEYDYKVTEDFTNLVL